MKYTKKNKMYKQINCNNIHTDVDERVRVSV